MAVPLLGLRLPVRLVEEDGQVERRCSVARVDGAAKPRLRLRPAVPLRQQCAEDGHRLRIAVLGLTAETSLDPRGMTRLIQLVSEGGNEVRVVGPCGTAKPLLGLLVSVQREENDAEGADREGFMRPQPRDEARARPPRPAPPWRAETRARTSRWCSRPERTVGASVPPPGPLLAHRAAHRGRPSP